jgi:hypothetical protein
MGRYSEARESLNKVAHFNGASVDLRARHSYDDFVFDAEVGMQGHFNQSDGSLILSRGRSLE